MITKSRAEMEREHYWYLKNNPFYRAEFMIDVLNEELSMRMPYYIPEEQPKEIKPQFRSRKIHDELDQVKAELQHIHLEVDRLKSTKRKRESF